MDSAGLIGTQPGITPLAAFTILPQEGRIQVVVGEAITPDGRRFFIGKGIGRIEPDGQIAGTDICRLVMDRLMKMGDPNAPPGSIPVYVLELAALSFVDKRLKEYIEKIRTGDMLMLLCGTSDIIDAVLPYFPYRKTRAEN